jgi:hypothetical protein
LLPALKWTAVPGDALRWKAPGALLS